MFRLDNISPLFLFSTNYRFNYGTCVPVHSLRKLVQFQDESMRHWVFITAVSGAFVDNKPTFSSAIAADGEKAKLCLFGAYISRWSDENVLLHRLLTAYWVNGGRAVRAYSL